MADKAAGFEPVAIDQLPARVRTSTISEEDKAAATAVAAIVASGQAARSGTIFTDKQKATTAGSRLARIIGSLSLYGGKLATRTLPLADGTFTFAILPKDEVSPAPAASEAPAEATS